jgi:hypothetical protein
MHEYAPGIRVHLRLRTVQVFVKNSWTVRAQTTPAREGVGPPFVASDKALREDGGGQKHQYQGNSIPKSVLTIYPL